MFRKEKYVFDKGYRVSEDGRLLNPDSTEIFGTVDANGYRRFNFRYNGKFCFCMVHRLQAFQSFGEKIYRKGMVVRHLNGVKLDASKANLALGTQSQNMMDCPLEQRLARCEAACAVNRKYLREDVILFHKTNGSSYRKTMAEFGISSKGTLHFVLNGRP